MPNKLLADHSQTIDGAHCACGAAVGTPHRGSVCYYLRRAIFEQVSLALALPESPKRDLDRAGVWLKMTLLHSFGQDGIGHQFLREQVVDAEFMLSRSEHYPAELRYIIAQLHVYCDQLA